MQNLDLYNTIINNPIYLSVTVVLGLLLIYSVLKKFIKLIFFALMCIILYLGFLYVTGDSNTVEDIDNVMDSIKESKEFIQDQIQDNIHNE